jgi:hypothetical protein
MRRRIFEFFNQGAGFKLSATAINVHFKLWQRRHPTLTFGDYYAGTIAASLRRGGSHKTLGDRAFLTASRLQDKSDFASRGRSVFETLLRHGLEPHYRCIDYGCGSLRIGQHIMRHVEPGNYFGVDMVDDFYRAGQRLLPSALLSDKQPRFGVIDGDTLQQCADFRPDFIVSIAVLKHVPPNELKTYFAKILSLMHRRSTVLITFNRASVTTRSGGSIWDFKPTDLERCVRYINPALTCTVSSLVSGGDNAEQENRAMMVIRFAS